jgi:hypothetical protein
MFIAENAKVSRENGHGKAGSRAGRAANQASSFWKSRLSALR